MIYTLTLNPAVDRELTVPAMEFDSVLRASESRVDFGGKGFNVSRLLKGMEEPSTAVGFLGGNAGELLQSGLQSLGIGTDFVWVAGETRTNISIVTQTISVLVAAAIRLLGGRAVEIKNVKDEAEARAWIAEQKQRRLGLPSLN